MKRLALSICALALLFSGSVLFAQENEGVSVTTQTFSVRPNIIACPGELQATFLPVLAQAELILDFKETEDILIVADGEITGEEGALIIRTTEIRISCVSGDDAAAIVDRSPSVQLNGIPPRDENLEGLPEEQSGYAIVNTDNLNIRSCDNPTCTVIGITDGGDSLFVLGRNADDSWWYVREGDLTGWVWGDLIILRGDLSDVPVVTTVGEITPPSFYVGFTGNPIYTSFTESRDEICTIGGDTFYPLVARNNNESWYVIEAPCLEDGNVVQGWIQAERGIVRNTGLVDVPILRIVDIEGD